ncbi:cation transporter, partial [Francisella tularensis subsp. holarctica]|nr:cation transporter [Francisella tularensis subsp. holarctica]
IDVKNHESWVIKQEYFEPSRAEILTKIKEFFAENNIDENVILDKNMSIYYIDDYILVDLYVIRSNDLKRRTDKLSKLSYRG